MSENDQKFVKFDLDLWPWQPSQNFDPTTSVWEIARVCGHYAVQAFKVADFGTIESRMRLAISE